MHFKTDLAPTGEGHGGAVSKLKIFVAVLLFAMSAANNADAQSKQDDDPCIGCAVVVIGGGLLIAAIADAIFGGGSSSSSSDKDCSDRLIPAPEGGLMSSNPDC